MQAKKKDFSEWYNEILESAELSDKRYPVKGMNIWLPYGLKAMNLIDAATRHYNEEYGIEEVSFPVLITRNQLEVEFEHLKGFEGQLYWVARAGNDQLDVELALRPTSEAAMYPMFSLWIRNHADLPKKVFQICSVYRYETKHTRSFLRMREFRFYEAHTAHVNYEDAEKQIKDYMGIWKKLNEILLIPNVINRRPDWDKFPGAQYSLAVDSIMPDGRTLQVATMHQYGENFSRTYDIKYSDENGEQRYVSQTTYGMSERLLGGLIGIHGDDKGLIFPPGIAPIQVIIIPIPSEKADISGFSSKINERLKAAGIRSSIDTRDNYTPGWKYNYWEMKGVPVRIEVGEREVNEGRITVNIRISRGRKTYPLAELETAIQHSLSEHGRKLLENSEAVIRENVKEASTVEEMKKPYAFFAIWCGRRECSDEIERVAEKSCLGVSVSHPGKGKCIVCGGDGERSMFSRTY